MFKILNFPPIFLPHNFLKIKVCSGQHPAYHGHSVNVNFLSFPVTSQPNQVSGGRGGEQGGRESCERQLEVNPREALLFGTHSIFPEQKYSKAPARFCPQAEVEMRGS